MFKKLQQKWKVSGTNLALILCTFAVTGTLTAWISRQITGWLNVSKYSTGWWLLKLGVLLIGYQVIILIIGFCFGQFRFFWNYEKKILRRIGILKNTDAANTVKQIAIFASGAGSNARQIINYFASHPKIRIALLVCNRPGAGVLQAAREAHIPVLMVEKERFTQGDGYVSELKARNIHFIALAGFLWKLPPALLNAWPRSIVNIHPALLPAHGGPGMYGLHVHRAVLAAGEKQSGITIHYADELYDHGPVIFQAQCPVAANDTPETLAAKVQQLELAHYPAEIEKLLTTGS